MFIEKLRANIDAKNLLKHEFYQLWSEGKLNQNILADYAQQYYPHVEAFPRYISLIHSQCNDHADRQVLLENLIEEERGTENHPKLWRDFAFSLGNNEVSMMNIKQYKTTEFVVKKFFDLCKKSYASGLGALYAYEYQTPEIAKTKIKGLKDFYGIDSEEALKFFKVHQQADEWHSEEVATLIEKLSPDQKIEAFDAASAAADALWGFLDGMMIAHNLCEKCDG